MDIFPQLGMIKMQTNKLTGVIPTAISTLKGLGDLFLENNMLSGSLDGVFNATIHTHLFAVNLAGNR